MPDLFLPGFGFYDFPVSEFCLAHGMPLQNPAADALTHLTTLDQEQGRTAVDFGICFVACSTQDRLGKLKSLQLFQQKVAPFLALSRF